MINVGLKENGTFDRSWNWIHNGQFHNRVRILVGWIPDLVNVQVAVVHLHLNHCRVTIKSTNVSFCFTILYGLNQVADRKSLWNTLVDISTSMTNPWCIIGDFNAVFVVIIVERQIGV